MAFPPAYGSKIISYSEVEQKVPGVKFIDGKQVYQITVDCGALLDDAAKSVAHGVADIDFIIGHEGYSQDTSSGATLPLPNISVTGTFPDNLVRANVDRTNVVIQTASDRTAFDRTVVTFWYTKT